MTRNTQHLEVRNIVRPAATDRHNMVALPLGRHEQHPTRFAFPVRPLEPMLTVPGILRVTVMLPIWVPGVTLSLVQLRRVQVTVVALRRPPTDQTRARPTAPDTMLFTACRTIRVPAPTHDARLRADHLRHSRHVSAPEPTFGKNARPHESQTRIRRFSCRSCVRRRSLTASNSCASRTSMSWSR